MAVSDSTPHVYDLLNRLNAAFARVHRNMEALEQTGMFEPETMKRLSRLSEGFRAESNSALLKTLHGIEERDLMALRAAP